jgi:hypothetical protein
MQHEFSRSWQTLGQAKEACHALADLPRDTLPAGRISDLTALFRELAQRAEIEPRQELARWLQPLVVDRPGEFLEVFAVVAEAGDETWGDSGHPPAVSPRAEEKDAPSERLAWIERTVADAHRRLEEEEAQLWLGRAFERSAQAGDPVGMAVCRMMLGNWRAAPLSSPGTWNLFLQEGSADGSPATRGAARRTGRTAHPIDDTDIAAAWYRTPNVTAVARHLHVSRSRVRARLHPLGLEPRSKNHVD